jgi:hypothetical protein
MLSNNRPSILLSGLPALAVDLCEGKNTSIVCRDCKRWVEINRGLVQVHRVNGVRCDGSRQHVVFDLTPARHERRRNAAQRAALARRTQQAADAIEYGLTHVPVPSAVHQIAARSPFALALRARRAAAPATA